MDPISMNELFPNWKELGAPLNQPVTADEVLVLTEGGAIATPQALIPDNFHNHGNYVISLGNVTRWLGQQAEALGVEIFPGFAAAEVLYNDDGSVKGVATGNLGIDKSGEPTGDFQLGMELLGKYTIFAEGARGHLGKQLIAKFKLDEGKDPQSYAIGIKELWEIDPAKAKPGLVVHTAGWPMDTQTYGGGFLYHLEDNKVTLGFVTAARIKGSHAAMKTGMLCAEAIFEALNAGRQSDELTAYAQSFDKSWLKEELNTSKNFKQWFKKGMYVGMLMTGIEHWLLPKLGIKEAPWTIHRTEADHTRLLPAAQCKKIEYPKPDGKITFGRLSSVFVSNTNHNEHQPAHLTLKNASVPVQTNLAKYAGPESRYCPAGVYEFVKTDDNQDKLVINAQNCVHCKTCDIKDPTQNIVWITPEGGGGPNYAGM